ncbi:hypothetical protein [Marinicellulosiphila megalodicopiae]|uniref:hypothetical protein n=1 Tax=Marinicellulosiphila megalodicopiae TaxID=2724896 RepID=UPI003BB0A32C
MVCLCIAFLGYTLDSEEIDSYYSLFNGTTDDAYDASVEATTVLNEQVLALQAKILTLSETSNLSDEEKTTLTEEMLVISTSQEEALEKLQMAQVDLQTQYNKIQDQLSPTQAKEHFISIDSRNQKIENQLKLIKERPKFESLKSKP